MKTISKKTGINLFPAGIRVAIETGRPWCGEQDSNLRTDKDCDLNAAPLTKLGDPRSDSAFRFPFIKIVNLNAS